MRLHRSEAGVLELRAGAPLRLDAPPGHALRVLAGTAWITTEGRAQDLFVSAGGSFVLGPAATVVEGIGPVRIELVAPCCAPGFAGAIATACLGRLRHIARGLVVRTHLGAALPAD
jgi:hypothetical protein